MTNDSGYDNDSYVHAGRGRIPSGPPARDQRGVLVGGVLRAEPAACSCGWSPPTLRRTWATSVPMANPSNERGYARGVW